MKIYRFDPEVGKVITHYESNFLMSKVMQGDAMKHFSMNCMYIPPNGCVGYHQAQVNQLFLVVRGEGWVRAGETECHSIKEGEAVLWSDGEFHETGSTTGLVAIVIESESITQLITMIEK